MKPTLKFFTTLALLTLAVLIIGCTEKTPDRDQIPILKQRLFELQTAVASRSAEAIDSLLSAEILKLGESSDSLINYVYGRDGSFAFTQFGDAQIFYTDDRARIDCYVMDSTRATSRPITFTLVLDRGQWLFKRFDAGKGRIFDLDSSAAGSVESSDK